MKTYSWFIRQSVLSFFRFSHAGWFFTHTLDGAVAPLSTSFPHTALLPEASNNNLYVSSLQFLTERGSSQGANISIRRDSNDPPPPTTTMAFHPHVKIPKSVLSTCSLAAHHDCKVCITLHTPCKWPFAEHEFVAGSPIIYLFWFHQSPWNKTH